MDASVPSAVGVSSDLAVVSGRVSVVVPTRGPSWSLATMLDTLSEALPLGSDVEVV
ncbi:MAG: hypothetical protein RLZZ272_1132, partial [Actinomycetota bacterium]